MHDFRYGVVELELTSAAAYEDPVREAQTMVVFTAPSGQQRRIRAFWDGGRTWRVRFSPEETGPWRWESSCAAGGDAGLHGVAGRFGCRAYDGDNPLYRHGPLRVAAGNTFLEHADGTPFFWLGDTAWNGVIRGDDDNWRRFLEHRRDQRFTVVQFVASHWRGDALDEQGEACCTEETPIQINPGFFQRLDRRIAMINEHGLAAAPVALWSLLPTDLGYKLAADDAVRLAQYIVARYDAYQVVWLLGGDGNYQQMGVDRWQRLGRRVFDAGHDRLVTLHPCGQNWVGEEFRQENWFDLIGYQSGHGDSLEHLRWLVQGPPANQWRRHPVKPVINLEPNYETAIGYQQRTVFTDYHVRRAAWWSLLIHPPAGLTYGHDAIWNWNFVTGPSEGHGNWHDRAVPPWHTGLSTAGLESMTVLRGIVERLPWTGLQPAPELLAAQPGEADPGAFVAAARAADGTVVVYAPCGAAVRLRAALPTPCRRVDPRTGEWAPCDPGPVVELPDGQDWLLIGGPNWRS